MSVFSDEDLKRLRIWLTNPKFTSTDGYLAPDTVKLVDAAIARLEAAEMCCQFMWISEHPIDDAATDAYKAWRKACGRPQ